MSDDNDKKPKGPEEPKKPRGLQRLEIKCCTSSAGGVVLSIQLHLSPQEAHGLCEMLAYKVKEAVNMKSIIVPGGPGGRIIQ